MSLFEIKNLSVSFGGIKAVTHFNLSMESGEIAGLIGPNGAGKTTVFNLITGVYTPQEGELFLSGKKLKGKPYQITKQGMARTFQNIRIFSELTLLENVLVSFNKEKPYSDWQALLKTPYFLKKEEEIQTKAYSLLDFFGLKNRALEKANALSYGEQRKLEMARALATSPKVLLLDEPAAGLNSKEKEYLMSLVRKIREHYKVAILLIEHDMKLVMGICEKIVVLDHGETIAMGTPHQIQHNQKVIEAYLGVA